MLVYQRVNHPAIGDPPWKPIKPIKPVVRHGQASQGQVQGSSEISLEPKWTNHGKIPWEIHGIITSKSWENGVFLTKTWGFHGSKLDGL